MSYGVKEQKENTGGTDTYTNSCLQIDDLRGFLCFFVIGNKFMNLPLNSCNNSVMGSLTIGRQCFSRVLLYYSAHNQVQ